jgi:Pregnancy-associated plasma protein-A
MRNRTSARIGVLAATASLVLLGAGSSAGVSAAPASPAVELCADGSVARVADDATAKEPALYSKNEANAYGVLRDLPTLPDGSVTIPTVFHMIGEDTFTAAEKARWNTLIAAQMKVLNDSYSGATSNQAADTPFRFDLVDTTWTVNPAWYTVAPGKNERDMKKALYTGDARTLNIYAGNIGGGLLGWAYFPKGYNHGRDYIDGVVILDESMPGGVDPDTGEPWKYGLGDTLTHEVGHWMMLEHTFARGCSAAGDFVADTPPEAHPQFDCPVGADTCPAPGLDPIHNFMDYTQDSCMDMFTQGQADRMSDAWQQFRAGGGKGS